ncbi:hypothetical protein PIB30_066093 [Stylosanthes scabra]|uniref:Uncharacterized protein n=1 Tax=Stylosanthes scabra TaxID=79078 RepID=A0ABU6QLN8_9FABA|nr:hypothetical protein [Stylosanthes scabra]
MLAHNARQVYYMTYPSRARSNWRVVIKCKPRGMIESQEEQVQDEPYQNQEETQPTLITDTEMPHALCSPLGKVDIVNLPEMRLMARSVDHTTHYDDYGDHLYSLSIYLAGVAADSYDSHPESASALHGDGWYKYSDAATAV